jgi:hypothetical protein
MKAVVFDIEGTLICDGTPNLPVINICKLYEKAGYTIIIATGQPESGRKEIEADLYAAGVKYHVLLMKPDADTRRSREWKPGAIETYLRLNKAGLGDVELVFENHKKSCKVWEKLAVPSLLVYGEENE